MSNGSGPSGSGPALGRDQDQYKIVSQYPGYYQGSRLPGVSDLSGYPGSIPGFRPGPRTSAKFPPALYRNPNAPDWQTTKCKV